jgi:hypothetical protein
MVAMWDGNVPASFAVLVIVRRVLSVFGGHRRSLLPNPPVRNQLSKLTSR